jgi:hypothetical protein
VQTVNLSANAFNGSNPLPTTTFFLAASRLSLLPEKMPFLRLWPEFFWTRKITNPLV